MNTDKAYILGLVIGGGIWGNIENKFTIRLPYNKWGSYEAEPRRASQISADIMRVVSPMFKNTYGVSISYEATKSIWYIICEGDLTAFQADLERYGIYCEGELRKNAEIDKIVIDLVDDNLKRRFIAGLADTIGSTRSSHRRYSSDKQIISFEMPKETKYNSICSLCKLLYSVKCYPDQMVWNHPNLHCSTDQYYRQWHKGFKLRVLSDQYADFGAFSFTSKAQSLQQNRQLEKEKNKAETCETKIIDKPKVSCVHPAENDTSLPLCIRGGHYFHNRHICAVMGCKYAPYDQIVPYINKIENYINPFTILTKGSNAEIQSIIDNESLLKNRKYEKQNIKICDVLKFVKSKKRLLFSNDDISGYPLNKILEAINYLISAVNKNLKGKRPRGKRDENITAYLSKKPNATIEIFIPDLLTPLIIKLGDNSALVGADNPKVYKQLIQKSPDSPYKIIVRPIVEDDLK